MKILDIHTHHQVPQPEGVISVRPQEFNPLHGQYYSVGIHPWDTSAPISSDTWKLLEKYASTPEVVAIGECGIDTAKGAPLFIQMNTLRRQIELSEKVEKPLVIHDVKAHDIIIGLRRDLSPRQPWVIHGFRGKPSVAAMLVKAGLWISLGEKFNPAAITEIPKDMLLAETDDSLLSIIEIINGISGVAGYDLTDTIIANTLHFLGMPEETAARDIK